MNRWWSSEIVKDESKTVDLSHWQDYIVAGGCLLATGSPLYRRQEHYTGVCTKREKLRWQCAIEQQRKASCRYQGYWFSWGHHRCRTIRTKADEDVSESGGLNRSSDEVFVMRMERRVQLIRLYQESQLEIIQGRTNLAQSCIKFLLCWMRRAVWRETFKHGSVGGLGWNALAYSTLSKN